MATWIYSVIDELPPEGKLVVTLQRSESTRHKVMMDFVKEEIAKGRQAYIVYPLIEESSKGLRKPDERIR